jgi:hypothetical protein
LRRTPRLLDGSQLGRKARGDALLLRNRDQGISCASTR